MTPIETTNTTYLRRPGGRIAYEVSGTGPLVVCAPGMGDLRQVYRFLAPGLVEAGYRVAAMDLRGHGDSDATFSVYDDVAAGEDMLALVEQLGGPAVLVGNSMGAGAAVWATAERPDMVSGLVLIGPFVRDIPVSFPTRLALRMALLRPWGRAVWRSYYARLYPGQQPTDLGEYLARIKKSMSRPGYWRSFVATTRTSHAPAEARLDRVGCPSLVVMGEKDPDFSDPTAEAEFVAGSLGGEVLVVPEAGHYPQAEYPEMVNPAVVDFINKTVNSA